MKQDLAKSKNLFARDGFTIVELLVASVIGTFIALTAVGTLRIVSASAETVDQTINIASEVRFAARRISTDLVNFYRDTPSRLKFIGLIEDTGYGEVSNLTFYTISRSKARPSMPEGDVYEVQYYLAFNGDKGTFMRRFRPNPDPTELEPITGGILTSIAEGIDIFQVRYFDGQEWLNEWPEEMNKMPDLLEVTIGAKGVNEEDIIFETVLANFVSAASGDSSPFDETEAQEAEEAQAEAEAFPE